MSFRRGHRVVQENDFRQLDHSDRDPEEYARAHRWQSGTTWPARWAKRLETLPIETDPSSAPRADRNGIGLKGHAQLAATLLVPPLLTAEFGPGGPVQNWATVCVNMKGWQRGSAEPSINEFAAQYANTVLGLAELLH